MGLIVISSLSSFTTVSAPDKTIPTIPEATYSVQTVAAVSEPTPVVVAPRYGFTDAEVYLLAQLLCGSAKIDGDGEYDFVWSAKNGTTNYCEIGKVLCVVMNRVRSGKYPDTVTKVIMQKGQFSPMPKNAKKTPDPIAIEVVKEWCTAYDNWDPCIQSIPEDHLYFRAGPKLTNVTY